MEGGSENVSCSLCGSRETYTLLQKGGRAFYRCRSCFGAFVVPRYFLNADAERARFSLHHNILENSSYRAYLQNIADAVLEHCAERARPPRSILDFGCGEQAALAELLRAQIQPSAARITGYDPLYPHLAAIPRGQFDLVFCVETAEHFKEPRRSFETLASLCAAGGLVALATHLAPRADGEFAAWWYKEDRTHYAFYSLGALVQLAHNAGLAFEKELIPNLYAFTRQSH